MARHNIHHEDNGKFVPKDSPEASASLRRAPAKAPPVKPYVTSDKHPGLSKWARANGSGK